MLYKKALYIVKKYQMNLNSPIQLCGEPIHNPIDFLHWAIENLILFKWTFFKNRPRVNFILIKSILTVTTVSFIIFLITIIFNKSGCITNKEKYLFSFLGNNLNSLLITFFSATSIIYWQTTAIFQKKWLYCNELYNTILSLNEQDHYKRNILSNALSIDLLTLDLWAHRSFQDFFRDELNIAIKNIYSNSNPMLNTVIEKVNKGYFNENDILKILEMHQIKLCGHNV